LTLATSIYNLHQAGTNANDKMAAKDYTFQNMHSEKYSNINCADMEEGAGSQL